MPSINNVLIELIEIVEELNNIDDDYLKEYYI